MTLNCRVIRGFSSVLCTVLAIVCTFTTAGCISSERSANIEAARLRAQNAAGDTQPQPYAPQAGDELSVKFFYNPELDTQTTVRPDGHFVLPLIGEVDAAGKPIPALTSQLRERYAPLLKHPEIAIQVTSFASQVVYVGGEVRRPGIVGLVPGMTVMQGLVAAGGWLSSGNVRKVVVVRYQGTSEPEFLLVDLRKGIHSLAETADVPLHPKDMIIVPKTGIAKANQFIREYVRDMLPVQSSFSIQYQFTQIPGF